MVGTTPKRTSAGRASRQPSLGAAFRVTALLVGVLIAVFPFAYLVLQSLAPWDEVNRLWIPTSLTLRSYSWLFFEGGANDPWLRALLNSFVVTLGSASLMVVSAGMMGYALAQLRFRGRALLDNVILFQMFFPAIILLVPTFLVVRSLGMYNTYFAMILPKAVSVWAIFMYASFFRSISKDVIDAARIDGASELQVVFRIVVPISVPITTIVALFLFMERWGELLWDLLVVSGQSMMTLNVLVATLNSTYASYPGPLYAASTVLTLPVLIVFWFFRGYFTRGISFVFK